MQTLHRASRLILSTDQQDARIAVNNGLPARRPKPAATCVADHAPLPTAPGRRRIAVLELIRDTIEISVKKYEEQQIAQAQATNELGNGY
jgi:hypothetical protein